MPGQPRGDEKQHPSSFHRSDPRNLRLTFDRAAFMRCGVVPINQKSTNTKRDVNQFNTPHLPPSPPFLDLDQRLRTGQRVQNIPTVTLINVRVGKKKHCSRARDKSNQLVVPFISMSDRFKWRQIRIDRAPNPLDAPLIATITPKRLYIVL